MSTNFRALCVELTEALRRQHDWYIEDNGATLPQLDELVRRAETALAEPEPEGPTPLPIPVSERLPGPDDCDAEGLCWWWCSPAERWLRCGIPQPDPTSRIHTHWLPAHALPLPS